MTETNDRFYVVQMNFYRLARFDIESHLITHVVNYRRTIIVLKCAKDTHRERQRQINRINYYCGDTKNRVPKY